MNCTGGRIEFEMRRFVCVASAIAVLAAVVLSAAYGAGAGAAEPGTSFVSLWQPRAGKSRIVLQAFSLHDGRPLRTLEPLPSRPADVSSPHMGSGASLWITVSTGPRYRNDTAGGDPAPNSCTSRVVSFDPASGKTVTRLAFPSSMLVTDGVPSPDGQRIVMRAGGCSTSFFNQYLLVDDLATGRRLTIGAAAAACHALSSAAWSPNGSQTRLCLRTRDSVAGRPTDRGRRLHHAASQRACRRFRHELVPAHRIAADRTHTRLHLPVSGV